MKHDADMRTLTDGAAMFSTPMLVQMFIEKVDQGVGCKQFRHVQSGVSVGA